MWILYPFLIDCSCAMDLTCYFFVFVNEELFVNKKGLPSPAVVYEISSSDPENKDSISQSSDLPPLDKKSVRSEPVNQFSVTSTSCISEIVGADFASNGPTLSPSSSLCSSSSERSTLNPNAKVLVVLR